MTLSTRFALQFGLTAAVTVAAVMATALGLFSLRIDTMTSDLGDKMESAVAAQLRRDSEALLGALAEDARDGLVAYDRAMLDRVAANALRRSSAVALAVYDSYGRTMADGAGPDTAFERTAPRPLRGIDASDGIVRWYEGPLMVSGKAVCVAQSCLGAVSVSVDAAVIQRERAAADAEIARARQEFFVEAGVLSGVALVLGTLVAVLVGWLLGRRLMRSLKSAVSSLEQLAAGATSVTLDAKQEELRELASAVEKVAERLATMGPEQDAILADMADGLFVAADGRLIVANPALHALFGRPDGTLVDGDAYALFALPPQPDAETFRAALGTLDSINRADGTTAPVMISAKVSPGREGQPARVIGVIRDVADRVAVERQLVEAQLRAEAADKAKAEFLAVMSHELRTPLNGVLGGAAVLAGSELTDKQRSLVGVVQSSGRSLLTMVTNLLDFSRTDPAAAEVAQVPVDLESLARRIAAHVADDAAAKGLDVSVRVQPDVPGILADDEKLLEIGQKLAENAVKFTEAGVVGIDIGYDRDGNRLAFTLTVDDTGIGIDESQREAIFDMFTQADSSETRAHTGSGMGLAITKRLADLMDGEITVESEPGVGTTFRVALSAPIDPDAVAPPKPEALDGARTMVVGHTARERDAIAEQLDAAGAQTEAYETAAAAKEALAAALAEGKPFGLVVHPDDLADFEPSGLADWLRTNTDGTGTASLITRPEQPLLRGPGGLPDRVQAVDGPATASALMEAAATAMAATATRDEASPARAPAAPLREEEAPDGRPAAVEPTPAPTPRVLLAEANEVNRIVLSAYLKKAGYIVDTVENGFEAVRHFKEQRPTLVLMDVEMPVMNGLDAAKAIRAHEIEEGLVAIPIIGLAAPRREGERERCAAAGMNDHLPKPIKIEELEAKLERWTAFKKDAGQPQRIAS